MTTTEEHDCRENRDEGPHRCICGNDCEQPEPVASPSLSIGSVASYPAGTHEGCPHRDIDHSHVHYSVDLAGLEVALPRDAVSGNQS